MRSKNSKPITDAERAHLERVKSLPCGVCDAAWPSEAHHIIQGDHWTTIPLCPSCHRDSVAGIHGLAVNWRVAGKTELGVLNETIAKLNGATIRQKVRRCAATPSKIIPRAA